MFAATAIGIFECLAEFLSISNNSSILLVWQNSVSREVYIYVYSCRSYIYYYCLLLSSLVDAHSDLMMTAKLQPSLV
jgi:hypothetical protein